MPNIPPGCRYPSCSCTYPDCKEPRRLSLTEFMAKKAAKNQLEFQKKFEELEKKRKQAPTIDDVSLPFNPDSTK